MKKIYKIEIDCANCANKIENKLKKLDGINSVNINFMMSKMTVDYKDNINIEEKLKEIIKISKKVDLDFELKEV